MLRRCRRIAQTIRRRLDLATQDELSFFHVIREIEKAPWAAAPSLRQLPPEYGPNPSATDLFSSLGPTHEAQVSPPPLGPLSVLLRRLTPEGNRRPGRPRNPYLSLAWAEAQQLHAELGTWDKAAEEYNRLHGTEYPQETISGWGRYLKRQNRRPSTPGKAA
ncbi:MAG: hypothetical protein JWO38_8252 [Gemmataceae bacterium]|nr:hypothetical protein [Gemmataceae bacterium]